MKKFLILFSVLGVFSSCGQKPNGVNPKNWIAAGVSLYDPQDVKSFVLNQKLSREQVMDSMSAMRLSFKSTYIGYNAKKDLIGMSGDEIFTNCNKMVPQQDSFTALEYYDLVNECIAQFKDSHVGAQHHMVPSFVVTAIGYAEFIDGKIIISRTRDAISKKIEEIQNLPAGSLTDIIKPGVEVIKVDGKPVMEAVKELETYVSGSSEAARMRSAVSSLFFRLSNFPSSKDLNISIKLEDGSIKDLTLPWIFRVPNSSLESRILLSEKGLLRSSDLSTDSNFFVSSGFHSESPLFRSITNTKSYLAGEDDDTVMLTGLINHNGKNFCYLQLNTFDVDPTSDYGFKASIMVGETKQPVNLLNEASDFLSNCDAFNAPLLLDLRENGGGYSRFADMFFKLFEKPKSPASYRAEAELIASGNQVYLNSALNETDKQAASLEDSLTMNAITSASKRNQNISDWVLTRNTTSFEAVFFGPVILATSYNCVSACEATVHRFQTAGRARIVGSPTAGTGFGFSPAGKFEIGYHDVLNLVDIKIPNHAFQTVSISDDSTFASDKDGKGSTLELSKLSFIENHPAEPEMTLQYTTNDILHNFADYRTAVVKLLDEAAITPPNPPVSTAAVLTMTPTTSSNSKPL